MSTTDPKPSNELVIGIMAGGAGERMWPLPPKQFLSLRGRSLLRQSFDRACGIVPAERIFILTAEEFLPRVREEIPEAVDANIIGEPLRRNTAAPIGLLAEIISQHFGPDRVVAILTADHHIEPDQAFRKAILASAEGAARHQAIFTLGIKPRYPATGFGYIEVGEKIDHPEIAQYRVRRFIEKPKTESLARDLIAAGSFWNSGMFVAQARVFGETLAQQKPAYVAAVRAMAERWTASGEKPEEGYVSYSDILREPFGSLEKISIDYAVMEPASQRGKVCCTIPDFNWTDLGSLADLRELLTSDSSGNAFAGKLIAPHARNNIVYAPGATVTLGDGVNDLEIAYNLRDRRLMVRAAGTPAEEVRAIMDQVPAPFKGERSLADLAERGEVHVSRSSEIQTKLLDHQIVVHGVSDLEISGEDGGSITIAMLAKA